MKQAFLPRAPILLYHRVIDLPADPQLLAVSTKNFAQQMDVLRRGFVPLPLEALPGSLQARGAKKGIVALTFDDGYADNLSHALPVLEANEMPATVFVTSGQLDQEREFWWDELERLLLEPVRMPSSGFVQVNGRNLPLDLADSAVYSKDNFAGHKDWNITSKNDPTERQRLYRRLHDLLQPLPHEKQAQALDSLRSWSGSEPIGRESHRALSTTGLVELANCELISIGAHTVTHPLLSALDSDAQRLEIESSKAQLEQILDQPISAFAYPYGHRAAYTAETVSLVRDAGFQLACSGFRGLVWPDTDVFQLPRFVVRDWDGDEFARRLTEWIIGQ